MENKNQNWRLTIQLTKEEEAALIEMRKQDGNCRLSYGELVRRMLDKALELNGGDKA
jgi:hypothetical protein